MRSVTPELAAAIEAAERVTAARLSIDWDGDSHGPTGSIDDLSDYVGRVSIERTLTSNLPAQVRTVAGNSAAGLVASLVRGNLFGQPVPVRVGSVSTATSGAGTSTTISLPRPAGARSREMVLVWIGGVDLAARIDLPGDASVAWARLAYRSDASSVTFSQQVVGQLLVRRVVDDEPATYTFNLGTACSWSAVAVVVGGPGVLGLHAYASTGTDGDPAATNQFTTAPITTSLNDCVLLTFMVARLGAGGGYWTAGPPGDTQLANICGTNGTANAAALVTASGPTAPGTYTKTATLQATVEPCVTVLVAVAPAQAGSDALNAALTFSELNPTGPYAGKPRALRPLRHQTGFATTAGIQYVPEIIGLTVRMPASSRDRRVDVEAIDHRMLFRGQAAGLFAPLMAESPLPDFFGTGQPNWPGLEATWLVSKIFANVGPDGIDAGGGLYASPPMKPYTRHWIPMHGSAAPFDGGVSYAYTQLADGSRRRIAFTAGPWVAATEPAPASGTIKVGATGNGLPAEPFDPVGTGVGRISYWVRRAQGTGTTEVGYVGYSTPTDRNALLRVTVVGALELALKNTITGPTVTTRTVAGPVVPADGAWHMIGAFWDLAAGTVRFRVDTANVDLTFTAFPTGTVTEQISKAQITITDGAQVSDILLDGGSLFAGSPNTSDLVTLTSPWPNEGFTPTAYIDPSLNVMDALVATDDGLDQWGLLNQLADAELAAVYLDADGHPHWRTLLTWVQDAGQSVARTLSAQGQLTDIGYDSGALAVRNLITVPYTSVNVKVGQQLWRAPSAIRVPAGQTVTVNAILSVVAIASGPTVLDHANTAPDGTGTDLVGPFGTLQKPLYIGYSLSAGRQLFVTVQNLYTFDVWLVDTSGSPSLSLTGSWYESGTVADNGGAQDTDRDRLALYGDQPLTLDANPWRQRADFAASLQLLLLDDLATPRPVITSARGVGDPRLEFGDRVRFVDEDGLGLTGEYWLTGISPTHEPNGAYTQAWQAREAQTVAVWDTDNWDDATVWGP